MIIHHIITQRFIIFIIKEKNNEAIAPDNLTIYSIALVTFVHENEIGNSSSPCPLTHAFDENNCLWFRRTSQLKGASK
jgi:hypothetical protein